MMKFRMFLNPIEFEADSQEDAEEIASKILVESYVTMDFIEPVVWIPNKKRC